MEFRKPESLGYKSHEMIPSHRTLMLKIPVMRRNLKISAAEAAEKYYLARDGRESVGVGERKDHCLVATETEKETDLSSTREVPFEVVGRVKASMPFQLVPLSQGTLPRQHHTIAAHHHHLKFIGYKLLINCQSSNLHLPLTHFQ